MQNDVGETWTDHGGDEARRHVEVELATDRAIPDALLKHVPQLLNSGFANGSVQVAHLGRRGRIGGGCSEARQARMLDEKSHAALDHGFEARPKIVVFLGFPEECPLESW